MKLVPEWQRVLKRAWSVRIMLLCTVLSAAGGALMMIDGAATGHPVLIPLLAFGLTAVGSVGGIISRVVQQKNLGED